MESIIPNSATNKSSNSTPCTSRPAFSRSRLKAEKARRSLHEFVRQAWHVLEPQTPFVDGIHVRAICEHLQAMTEGRLPHLIINVPPGHATSLLTAVFWPASTWIDHPESRWLFSSYREPLAMRDSVKCRRLIELHTTLYLTYFRAPPHVRVSNGARGSVARLLRRGLRPNSSFLCRMKS